MARENPSPSAAAAAARGAETAASPATGSFPRPAWRRERETGDEAPGLLDDLVGAQDLADLMEARHTPATHASWPVRRSQADPYMTIICPIDGAGWNHLLRGGPGNLAAPRVPRCYAALASLRMVPNLRLYRGKE